MSAISYNAALWSKTHSKFKICQTHFEKKGKFERKASRCKMSWNIRTTVIKIRKAYDRLNFILGIPLSKKIVFILKKGPGPCLRTETAFECLFTTEICHICVKIVFWPLFMDPSYRVRNEIIYVLSWRTINALPWDWIRDSSNKHQI